MRNAALAVLTLVFALLFTPLAQAQAPAPDPASTAAGVTAAGGPSAPVPVPEPSEKALRYYRSGNVLWAISTIWGLLVPLLLLFTGLSARMRDAARKVGRNWFFTVGLYGILFTLVTAVLSLPLDYYQGFVRPHAYGLSNQTLAKWLSDSFKELAMGAWPSALLLWVPYLLMRKSPRRWWLYTGLASIPFLFLRRAHHADLDRPAVQRLRPDEGQGPGDARSWPWPTGGDRGRAGSSRSTRASTPRRSTPTSPASSAPSGSSSGTRCSPGSTRRKCCSSWATRWGTTCSATSPGRPPLGAAVALFGLYFVHRAAGRLIARFRARSASTGCRTWPRCRS